MSIIEWSKNEVTISRRKGKWTKIKYSPIIHKRYGTNFPNVKGEFNGWVFSGFLTTEPILKRATKDVYTDKNGCFQVNQANFPKDFRSGTIIGCTGGGFTEENSGSLDLHLFSDHSIIHHFADYYSDEGSWQATSNCISIILDQEHFESVSVNACIERECKNNSIYSIEFCERACSYWKTEIKLFVDSNDKLYYQYNNGRKFQVDCLQVTK
ncbi:hypothetical protein [Leptospira saintgironsiae]|uniref:Uncharacterized protein n=1 Tax=Leptospira saintgironsiae TaxID=2023183 RepID=A0A2M9YA97_9LEPT|nr:hypothetical protein [Leptospira saintgironsiae]PJZ48481.1 hypothetical protein CH362_14870 [Leptospira saintgironsiae]